MAWVVCLLQTVNGWCQNPPRLRLPCLMTAGRQSLRRGQCLGRGLGVSIPGPFLEPLCCRLVDHAVSGAANDYWSVMESLDQKEGPFLIYRCGVKM
ncbi:hypothetical protein B0T20DRAFT_171217 [Sordaria brevicollis]|uniref:Uncharacterized protein n=1 Tax=Sordaria brevicollis TaxID=83679 RepID=A0AAE0PHB6_SORBR|nr:hypothetical protein B0T20DRAFT_171217 [Sordaria brevicollis]